MGSCTYFVDLIIVLLRPVLLPPKLPTTPAYHPCFHAPLLHTATTSCQSRRRMLVPSGGHRALDMLSQIVDNTRQVAGINPPALSSSWPRRRALRHDGHRVAQPGLIFGESLANVLVAGPRGLVLQAAQNTTRTYTGTPMLA